MFAKMSLSRAAMLGISALSLFAASAVAGPITFAATGALVGGATLSGNVVIDTTTGVVQSANLSVTSPISLSGATFDSVNSGQGSGSYSLAADVGGPANGFVVLDLPVTTLIGYTGGNICLASCNGFSANASAAVGNANILFFNSGSLTAVPEPASVVLAGSALLGLIALRRRNRSQQSL